MNRLQIRFALGFGQSLETVKQMEASIRDCIDTAAAGRGYILASGCEIPFDSTEDRIAHFFEYSREYGRKYMADIRSKVHGS